jgi:hypothetical protein
MTYEDTRQATLASTRAMIAKGATKRQIMASVARMRAAAIACVSYDREPMGPWPAHILSVAQEVADMARTLPT